MEHPLKTGIAALALAITSLGTASATDYRMISSWDDRYLPVKVMADAYIENVEAATNGSVKISRVGPEVVNAVEQLQPASNGVFQFLFSHGGYHAGTTGIALALDAIKSDPAQRRETGIWDFVDNYYQKEQNLKLLAIPVAGSEGYQLFLREPMGMDGLKGRKIRGTALYHKLITEFGGSPVVVGGPEIYSALQKGVIDGAGWALLGGSNFKWYEVAPYLARPSFGVSSHLIFMNLDAWNKLSPGDQTILLEEGRKLEDQSIAEFDEAIAAENALLKENGAKITEFPADKEKVEALWNDGVWQVALDGPAGPAAKEFQKLALDKGMTR